MPENAYQEALSALAITGPFGGDATDEYIQHTMRALGLTDAHVIADWTTSAETRIRTSRPSPGDNAPNMATTEGWAARRTLLAKVMSWVDVGDASLAALPATSPFIFDDLNPYEGMLATDVPWWDAAFAHFGMNGDKVNVVAEDWWPVAPADGWLAYAAGLSLDEYRDPDARPNRTTLFTLLALRSTPDSPRDWSHQREAAIRVHAALTAYAAHGGDLLMIGVRA